VRMANRHASAGFPLEELDARWLIFPVFPKYLDRAKDIAGAVASRKDRCQKAAAEGLKQIVAWDLRQGPHKQDRITKWENEARQETMPCKYYRSFATRTCRERVKKTKPGFKEPGLPARWGPPLAGPGSRRWF